MADVSEAEEETTEETSEEIEEYPGTSTALVTEVVKMVDELGVAADPPEETRVLLAANSEDAELDADDPGWYPCGCAWC